LNKLVGKTIAITLAVIMGVVVVAFGATALFAPKILAGIFDNMGAYSASVFFYEKNYDKTGEIEDLVLLIDKLDVDKDSQAVEQFLFELINDEEFDSYCASFGEDERLVPLKDYYNGQYAVALMMNGKQSDAISFCEGVVALGYNEYNPYRAIVYSLAGTLTTEQLTALKGSIEGVATSLSGTQLTLAQTDILDIDNLIQG
jgi:hypothetical protein